MDSELPFFGVEAAASSTLHPGEQLLHAANNATALPLASPAVANETIPHYYNDGEIIEQQWNGIFIFLAHITAFIGAYSAIRLLEHALWRSERERENASSK